MLTLFSGLFGVLFRQSLSKNLSWNVFSWQFRSIRSYITLIVPIGKFCMGWETFLCILISIFVSTSFERAVFFFCNVCFWYLYWKQTACHCMDLFLSLLFSSTVLLTCFGVSTVLVLFLWFCRTVWIKSHFYLLLLCIVCGVWNNLYLYINFSISSSSEKCHYSFQSRFAFNPSITFTFSNTAIWTILVLLILGHGSTLHPPVSSSTLSSVFHSFHFRLLSTLVISMPCYFIFLLKLL